MAAIGKPKSTARKVAARAKPAAPEPAPPPPAKAKAGKTVMKAARAKAMSARTPVPVPAAPVSTRVAPPSKGELRGQIEKLEAANAALKAKSRETNRTAKAANKQIAELEAELARLQKQIAHPVTAPAAEKVVRRGRSPRSREIDPGDAVPPGVAVLDPEPMDAEAEAARDALEEKLSGE